MSDGIKIFDDQTRTAMTAAGRAILDQHLEVTP